jgi:putative addiction module component (TIGR02574 family)
MIAGGRMARIDIRSLSREEKLQLLEQLWDSVAVTPEVVALTSAQRDELDRRLDELEQEGPSGIPWDEVYRRIAGRRN